MAHPHCLLWVLLSVGGFAVAADRAVVPLTAGWRFAAGDHPGAEAPGWNDAAWRALDLPHDWAFEAACAPDGAQGEMGGYKPGGIGWYRRSFDAPSAIANRRTRVEFDGVYMNSEVWLNGQRLGQRPYGYLSFAYDLTPHLRDGRNVLAVRVDNSLEPSARWYHGCGIYAPVRLLFTAPIHVAPSGVHIITTSLANFAATVTVHTEVMNATPRAAPIRLRTTVRDPAGAIVARNEGPLAVGAVAKARGSQELTVPHPFRWDIETPRLYTVDTEIIVDGAVIDTTHTRFGLREIRWETGTGFWLNGRQVKLLGVAEHLEGGPVGAAWPDSLIRWKLELLKRMGCNAVRTAHNPQVPRFYEHCDELGILVMDEIFDGWRQKAPHDYGRQAFAEWWRRDLTDWIRRDRNHPSVIIWSVGNETRGEVGAELVGLCHGLDPSRPVTSGHAAPEAMDVLGVNGPSERQRFFNAPLPEKPFVATEAPHTWQVRGFYRTHAWFRDGYPNKSNDAFPLSNLTAEEIFSYDWVAPASRRSPKQIFNSSYDNAMVRITARRNWTLMRDLPWFSGHFRWTGWDYPGEAGYVHGGWPFRAFMGGVIDLAGFPKDHYYFYQSQWTTRPMVHVLPHWTHPRMAPGTEIPVWAYTNAEEVELHLNGRSLGRRRTGREWDQLQCEWRVPWEPGTLEAVAYRGGCEVARTSHRTASAPVALQVTSERLNAAGDANEHAIVSITAVDGEGTPYPYGENRAALYLEGRVRFRSLENGNPVDTEPNFGASSRRLFFGLMRAFVEMPRDGGDVAVVAGAILGEKRQLTSDRVSIDVRRVVLRGSAPSSPLTIHYTLDGSEPMVASTRYRGSFPVQPGTTVRVIVLAEQQVVMRLSERFASDEGLHWGTSVEAHAPSVFGEQAEAARYDGAVIANGQLGFNGTGYIEFGGQAGWVEWYRENDGAAAPYRLVVRYAQKAPGELRMSVNGGEPVALLTGGRAETALGWKTASAVCELQNGGNRIRLIVPAGASAKIDELLILPPSLP